MPETSDIHSIYGCAFRRGEPQIDGILFNNRYKRVLFK